MNDKFDYFHGVLIIKNMEQKGKLTVGNKRKIREVIKIEGKPKEGSLDIVTIGNI